MKDPYRDYISANRILIRGWEWGWGSPDTPAEKEPLLVEIPASSIIEAGSPQAYSRG